ncbi:MAG: SGNH/GDSL hydrolase family protein [Kiritimatiellia bacterium]|jgi:hypothetical protein|nr:SGNH/GDSL hydrolase family protein [Kiritimatiellia bacterium]
MKKIRMAAAAGCAALSLTAAENTARPVPDWEFNAGKLEGCDVTGDLHAKGDTFFLDGQNRILLPETLSDCDNYTIEFTVKTTTRDYQKFSAVFFSFQDCDYEKGGFSMKVPRGCAFAWYQYGAGQLYYNGTQSELRFGNSPLPWTKDGTVVNKLTFLVKDNRIQYFRDGLIILMTDTIPARLKTDRLRFGALRGKSAAEPVTFPKPVEITGLKVYKQAVFPLGYDDSIATRHSCTGIGYDIMKEPVTDPSRPRILVVGDSISMGYRNDLANLLKGRAAVDYWGGGCWFGPDADQGGDESMPRKAWRGAATIGPYDIITYNPMTLHWWTPEQASRCSDADLPRMLQFFFDSIRAAMPKAKVIYVNCTPARHVREDGVSDLNCVKNDIIIRRNRIADAVARKNGFPVVDLYSLAAKHLSETPLNKTDTVHWWPPVNKEMAAEIYAEIDKLLRSE